MEKRRSMSTTQIIAAGFLIAIILGTLLLLLPISQSGDVEISVLDALFTATGTVCVTGLTTVDNFAAWSSFGHAVILLLMQMGGLGIVCFTSLIMLMIGRRVTLRDRLLIEEAFNLDTLSGLVKFLHRVFKWTMFTELAGAVCYSFVFVPEYGLRGIWLSVFMSVSAFCDAGIEIFETDSLISYAGSVWVNFVTIMLIILGGIGFIVRWDIRDAVRKILTHDLPFSSAVRRLRLHTKIVLIVNTLLLVFGTVAVFALEYNNPETLGNMPLWQKIMASAFQSTTLRTAGFYTFPQKAMRDTTAMIALLLMFIGASPVGTAGGVKTTTIALVVLAAASTAVGKTNSTVFRRTIPAATLRKAIGVVTISFAAVFAATFLVLLTNGGDFLDAAFEVVSAISTTGITRDYTASMNIFGKIVIIICMYLGRIGPISLAIAFNFNKGRKELAVYPDGDVTVG